MILSFMRYFEEGKYFYLPLIVLLLANILIQVSLVRTNYDRAEEAKKQYLNLREEKSKMMESLRIYKKSVKSFEAAANDIESFVSGLPSRHQMTKIIGEFHRVAKKSGLAISSSSYSEQHKKESDLIEYRLSFPISGRYGQVRRFIYNLEKMPYLMSIDDIGLSSNKDKKVSLSLNISLYLKAQEK